MDPIVSFLIIAVVVIIVLSVFLSFFPIMLVDIGTGIGSKSRNYHARCDALAPRCSKQNRQSVD